ncbi:MAG: hypothetical protein WC728_03645 [Elusimicrobiota bacterium]
MLDAMRDLVPFLGRMHSRANRRKLSDLLGCGPLLKRIGERVYWTFSGSGLEAALIAGRLGAWFLYARRDSGGEEFTGRLEGDLPVQATRREIHRTWGLPKKIFPPETERCGESEDHVIARHPWRDTYERAGCSVYIEYSSGLHEHAVRPATIILTGGRQPTVVKRSDPAKVSRSRETLACTFRCARCGKPAETVELIQGKDPVARYGFGETRAGLRAEDAAHMMKLLLVGDPGALHAFRPDYAASFCPACGVCYCREHWKYRHGAPPPWGDSYSWDWVEYGACPYGHERILREL